MADSKNKVQRGVLLTPEEDSLLDALHRHKVEETGLAVSANAYLGLLIREEASRRGLKVPAGKSRRSSG
jgi:hypothetical protein